MKSLSNVQIALLVVVVVVVCGGLSSILYFNSNYYQSTQAALAARENPDVPTGTPTNEPQPTEKPTATAAPTATPDPAGLPIMLIQQPPAPVNGLYHYLAAAYVDFSVIVEGTKPGSDTHLIETNPSDGDWDEISVWITTKSPQAVMDKLAIQFAGDKVLSWKSAKVAAPPQISINGDLLPGDQVPSGYSAELAGKVLPQPMKLFIHGRQSGELFSASVGSPKEWTFVHFIDKDGAEKTERFVGVQEGFLYKEILEAWRLPGDWTQDQVDAFVPPQ